MGELRLYLMFYDSVPWIVVAPDVIAAGDSLAKKLECEPEEISVSGDWPASPGQCVFIGHW